MITLKDVFKTRSRTQITLAVQETMAQGLTMEQAMEYVACFLSPHYFINNYVYIYDSVAIDWIPFHLWDAQKRVLDKFINHKMTCVLKTRQVGISWLALSYILWLMLFRAPASILVLSRREDEAIALLDNTRLRGMFSRLPEWLKPTNIIVDDKKQFAFSRGSNTQSTVRAMSTSSGDSYTATAVLIDEADLVPDLEATMLALEPTINAGGQMMLVSKSNKRAPHSLFKKIYRTGKAHLNDYVTDFVAWYEHPLRDADWYAKQKNNALNTEGHLDSLYESYPENDEQALAPSEADRRFNVQHLQRCYDSLALPITINGAHVPDIPDNVIKYYEPATPFTAYAIGVDLAEGLPNSDYTVAVVVEKHYGKVVAIIRGRIPPETMALYVYYLSMYYNNAIVMPERNAQGSAFILRSKDFGVPLGRDSDNRHGWNMSSKNKKILLFDTLADHIQNNKCVIRDGELFKELSLIEMDTLKAPEGINMYDDMAIAFALANFAKRYAVAPNNEHNVGLSFREWGD